MSSHWIIPVSATLSFPKCTCCNILLNCVPVISSISDMFMHIIIYERIVTEYTIETLSFTSQMSKHFEWANIKENKTKRISIMCAWLLMFIDNEYDYCAWNTIRIIEGSDNRGSDNRESTVRAWRRMKAFDAFVARAWLINIPSC